MVNENKMSFKRKVSEENREFTVYTHVEILTLVCECQSG